MHCPSNAGHERTENGLKYASGEEKQVENKVKVSHVIFLPILELPDLELSLSLRVEFLVGSF